MVVVMHMQKRTKQALQFSGAILAMASIVTVTLGAVPRETLLDWGRKAALFSRFNSSRQSLRLPFSCSGI